MICTENESKKVVSYYGIKYFVIIRSSTLRLFKNKILTRILTFLIMLTPNKVELATPTSNPKTHIFTEFCESCPGPLSKTQP